MTHHLIWNMTHLGHLSGHGIWPNWDQIFKLTFWDQNTYICFDASRREEYDGVSFSTFISSKVICKNVDICKSNIFVSPSLARSKWNLSINPRTGRGGTDFALLSCFSKISKKNLLVDSYELFSTWLKMNGASFEKRNSKSIGNFLN